MATYDFDYARANSVEEALTLMAQHGPNAKLLAGGHSLVPAMKLRLAAPDTLIDVSGLSELAGIAERGGRLHIGAMTTHRMVEHSDVLKANCPVLPRVASRIGDPQVRNRGTLGGSLAHADPAADYPAVVLALGAEIEITGRQGTRTVPADDFFVEMFATAVDDGEMLTKVVFPVLGSGEGAAYAKFANQASRYAVVGIAAMVQMAGGTCRSARVAVTGASPKAWRATSVEDALAGQPLNDETIAAAVSGMAEGKDMMSDVSASAEYRAHLCEVMAKKALHQAAADAQG